MRNDYETMYLRRFVQAADELGLSHHGGHGGRNCFDPGFDLEPRQYFQYGDLRVETADRTVLVEVESAGGLTNLVKYWPLACRAPKPMILLHVFALSSKGDYMAHQCLWKFTWDKMREDLMRTPQQRLIARLFAVGHDDQDGWDNVVATFRRYLTLPVDCVFQEG